MALVQCEDCGASVSDQAPACPRCGRPIAKQVAPVVVVQAPKASIAGRTIKIVFMLAFILATGLGIAFCVLLGKGVSDADRKLNGPQRFSLADYEWIREGMSLATVQGRLGPGEEFTNSGGYKVISW